jgi:CO/xanthine dehydrogenase Mo-binding subunit
MEVGQNVLRKEGYEMLTGVACYVDDITIKGMFFDTLVRIYILQGQFKMIT